MENSSETVRPVGGFT